MKSTAKNFLNLLTLGVHPSDAARAVLKTEEGTNSYRFDVNRSINTYWVSRDSSLALEILPNGIVNVQNCNA